MIVKNREFLRSTHQQHPLIFLEFSFNSSHDEEKYISLLVEEREQTNMRSEKKFVIFVLL
jgi:hypothetical protein